MLSLSPSLPLRHTHTGQYLGLMFARPSVSRNTSYGKWENCRDESRTLYIRASHGVSTHVSAREIQTEAGVYILLRCTKELWISTGARLRVKKQPKMLKSLVLKWLR